MYEEDQDIHPDVEREQAYIDFAHRRLEESRAAALRLHAQTELGPGGTHQARLERDILWDAAAARLAQLEIGDASLVFGRIDLSDDEYGGGTFYIGRVAVWDRQNEPVTVDWRAPIAEPFYRATGRQPMGLVRRRHFATRGRQLLGVEDEFFGEALGDVTIGEGGIELRGRETLVATLESARTGRLGDIVATIQGEQDEIIRSPLPGVLVVQGGPGTGKTVVALHRAAYLLYSHRFPLEGQGVLVVGPNRLFLTYIEQVLPSLGEAGVELVVLADLVPGVTVRGFDPEHVARVKGDLAMAEVIRKAVRDRERPLRSDLVIGFGLQRLRIDVDRSAAIVAEARRRFHKHNAGRNYVVDAVFTALADSSRVPVDADALREQLRGTPEVREAIEWMWPVLTPAELLRDLFGSKALLKLASHGWLSRSDAALLYRERVVDLDTIVWSTHDVPLLDEARAVLGPRPQHKVEDAVRTYGHIVVDEAQDLSPMQLRMLRRRSLNGSMTIVGDIAQATGAWAHDDWHDLLEHLVQRHEPRFAELTVGYRLPAPTMDLAARVLAVAAPQLAAPVSVRATGDTPRIVAATADDLVPTVLEVIDHELGHVGSGNLAVVCPDSLTDAVSTELRRHGVVHGRLYDGALEHQITVVPVGLVKGLELDATIVVEPAAIVAEEAQGMRALYVALTRATRRLTIVHARPLPEPLRDPAAIAVGGGQ
ncbi:MAG: AAA family ATPase [Acidimicrobiales bacterium]|nr:AAA family ATPase [Acidimicrobiales bacterium]